MFTAFQRNAFQNDAFQIDYSIGGEGDDKGKKPWAYIWPVSTDEPKADFKKAKQVERIKKLEPDIQEVRELKATTKPFVKVVNGLQAVDYTSLFKNELAKAKLERNLQAFNLRKKQEALAKTAELEALRLKRNRNLEALIFILAEV